MLTPPTQKIAIAEEVKNFILFTIHTYPKLTPKEQVIEGVEYYKRSLNYFFRVKNVTHREVCWINYFKADADLEKRFTKKVCVENGIRPDAFYSLSKESMTEDEFERIAPHLAEFPTAYDAAIRYLKNQQKK